MRGKLNLQKNELLTWANKEPSNSKRVARFSFFAQKSNSTVVTCCGVAASCIDGI